MSKDSWDYFANDQHYSDVLKDRLASGVEMDSARALATYLAQTCSGDLRVVDLGAGPGHYYPVLQRLYATGTLHYLGVDIDSSNVGYGAAYFRDNPSVSLAVGSVLDPGRCIPADTDCVISANTLPHVPKIQPLLELLAERTAIRTFVFRMLIGSECVQIKKHLREHDFDDLFERDYQFNNIYTVDYLRHHLGVGWHVDVAPDVFDVARLEHHSLPAQVSDPFYGNRVSRPIGSMVFKGEIYMPWKFVIGRRAG